MANPIQYIRRRLIRSRGKQVKARRVVIPIKQASRLAVLYQADDKRSELLIKKVTDFCKANHLTLVTFGYFDGKELNTHAIPHSNADFFCNKHLDWLKLPNKSDFLRFTTEKYDFLLNLYSPTCLPLLGVSSISEAKSRIGPYVRNYEFCFDLMLSSENDDLMHFTDEVLIYLKNFGNG